MKLWGGNYETSPDAAFWEFNRSFPFDRRLIVEEVAASRAWVRALGRCGAIGNDDAETLDRGLEQVLAKATSDPSSYLALDVEDVHSFVEERLSEIVGEIAGQAHLGRSRNEQTVTALRLFVRGAIDRLRDGTAVLVRALVEQGRAGADAVMPGYTHTRAAEVVTFGHWAAAHAWAIVRDHERLRDARVRVDVMPLGSGALAGTALPLDRDAMARDLGFAAVSPAALDAVMDRDFAIEFVSCCAQLQTHLARVAEDLIHFAGSRVRLRRAARGVHHGLEPHAAEEEPGRARARARQGRPRRRRPRAAARPAEGPARRLPEGPAGGQGGGVRRRRHRDRLGRDPHRRRRRPRPAARGDARRGVAARR